MRAEVRDQMPDVRCVDVRRIYEGSDGEATKELYRLLEQLGDVGTVAVNLFRAQKASARAKVYRGGGYRHKAYDKKNWSLKNLCNALEHCAAKLGIEWGWKIDPAQEYHNWVLYVDLPTGQVSFHAESRLCDKDYDGEWDGRTGVSAQRIIIWVQKLITQNGVQDEHQSNSATES